MSRLMLGIRTKRLHCRCCYMFPPPNPKRQSPSTWRTERLSNPAADALVGARTALHWCVSARAWSCSHRAPPAPFRYYSASAPQDQDGKDAPSVLQKGTSWHDWRRMLSLAHPERGKLAAAMSLLMISSAVTMSVPFCLGKVIDYIYSSGTAENAATSLADLCFILTGVFLCGGAANAGRVYLMIASGQRIVCRLREALFAAILHQEMAFFDKTRTGELVNRLSADTTLLGRAITENLSDGLRSLSQVTVGVGMMFYVSPKLATFVLSVVPPVALFAVAYGRYIRAITMKTQDLQAQATQVAEERIGSIRTVRAFAREEMEMKRYTDRVAHVLQLAYKEARARAGFFGVTGLSGNLIVLAVLYKGGILMQAAHITVGDLSAFLLYSGWVGISIAGMSSFYSELMKGLGAGTRLWELLDRKPAIPLAKGAVVPGGSLQGGLEFRRVSFAYPTRHDAPIFSDLNLLVPAGSVTAVVGPSGCGKSTLLSLLLRLYDPQQGQVLVDGHDIQTLNPSWLRANVGTVSQEPVLFSCSIGENITYGAVEPSAVCMTDLEHAARTANAEDFIRGFPQGFNTMVGEKGVLLSGGQKQRIAIARAILKNPKILLLDEATSALDSESEYLVQQALDRLLHGRTVLVIAHRLSTIQNADRIVVMAQGRVAETGTYAQLTSVDDGIFRKLVERQAAAKLSS
uniref:ATP-binding cassette sub-family B member 10, mitochondrial n=1 Tax=Eptatretus burgeri TaxID=7764 RepID=A0A8C4WZ60_EPTBU